MSLLRDRALSIQVVKKTAPPEKDATKTATLPNVDSEKIVQIATDTLGKAAVLVAGLYAGKVLLDTSSQVALIAARAKFR